jgi:hypothetical protein
LSDGDIFRTSTALSKPAYKQTRVATVAARRFRDEDRATMPIVEITDAIEIRRCKRALYFGRVVTVARDAAAVRGLVQAIRPNPRGKGVLATIKPTAMAASR